MVEPIPEEEVQEPDLEANPPLALTRNEIAESTRTVVEEVFLEPYLCLEEIANLHPESRINVKTIDQSRGLSAEEALKRLNLYGKNVLSPPPRTPEWKRFLQQFQNLFLILLILSALLSFAAYIIVGGITNIYLGSVLLGVVFLTGLLQFHEEGKALHVIDSFKNLLATTCTVYRDGRHKVVDVAELVPGDLVLVSNGDKIPADMVLLLSRGLKVEFSSLTGESEPVSCTDQPSAKDTRKFECKNLVFNSSLCFDGMAIGLVLATGDKSAIGTIAKLASETKARESVLQREVRNFVKLVGIIALSMAAAAFVIAVLLQGANTTEAVFSLLLNGFLTILVANVPQGLPSTVVSLLSLAARRMALRSVLVKRIDCVETLGSCSIICSDKTGTLTKNEMTVTDIWFNQRIARRVRKVQESMYSQEPQTLLFRAGILCNRAEPIAKKESSDRESSIRDLQMLRLNNASRLSWASSVRNSLLTSDEKPAAAKFKGNPSDVAILSYCDSFIPVDQFRDLFPIMAEVPFNSTNKWQLVVTKLLPLDANGDTEYEVLMKGAPEIILGKCTTYACTKGASFEVQITEAFRQEFAAAYERFASQGRRVLALCSRTFRAPEGFKIFNDDNSYNFPTSGLKFIGLVAIMDPPRDNVPEAVTKCLSAGVKVFMVTGDHPFTARAIAKEIGLLKSDDNIELLENETSTQPWETCQGAVIHGCRIDELTDEQWRTILSKDGGVCFARTTPAHKLLIVQKCQTLMGEIVAVTGDGVNDSPALKQADIGVAMGLNGSAVAQDAADILLMDDNFASIVFGIEEGRIIFDNIKKTIAYTMAHIFPEVVSVLIGLLAGLPAGLTPMQILTIDLGTELGPAISLAYEPAESNIMERKPRDPLRERLVSPNLLFYSYVTSAAIITAGCLVAYKYTYELNGLLLSDFHGPGIKDSGGDYFSLTALEPVTVERTGITYSPEEQRRIFSEGTTAFYITLTVAQFCHIWACKTRISSLFVHGFSNKLTFYGVAVGLVLVIFFCYVPGVDNFVGSAVVGWIPWVCALVTGLVLLAYNESAKFYIRGQAGKADGLLVRLLAW